MGHYFCGWYFRCQSDTQTLAIIPSRHKTANGNFCKIQFLSGHDAYQVQFPYADFRKTGTGIQIGENHFRESGISLNIVSADLQVSGTLDFGSFRNFPMTLWGFFSSCHFCSADTAFTVCATASTGTSGSMVISIPFIMLSDIWKETADLHFPGNIYGRNAAFRQVP